MEHRAARWALRWHLFSKEIPSDKKFAPIFGVFQVVKFLMQRPNATAVQWNTVPGSFGQDWPRVESKASSEVVLAGLSVTRDVVVRAFFADQSEEN